MKQSSVTKTLLTCRYKIRSVTKKGAPLCSHGFKEGQVRRKSARHKMRRLTDKDPFDPQCFNCGRGIRVNGSATIVRDGGHFFCASNCRWACLLDQKGARFRVAKRAKDKKTQKRPRRVRPVFEVDVVDADAGDEWFGGDGGNAMFGFHVCFDNDLEFRNEAVR